jgi:hypothetical protein
VHAGYCVLVDLALNPANGATYHLDLASLALDPQPVELERLKT